MTCLLLILATATLAQADERSECARLAPKYAAEVEAVMPDGSRCDLLTAEHAIEVDWPPSGKRASAKRRCMRVGPDARFFGVGFCAGVVVSDLVRLTRKDEQ